MEKIQITTFKISLLQSKSRSSINFRSALTALDPITLVWGGNRVVKLIFRVLVANPCHLCEHAPAPHVVPSWVINGKCVHGFKMGYTWDPICFIKYRSATVINPI